MDLSGGFNFPHLKRSCTIGPIVPARIKIKTKSPFRIARQWATNGRIRAAFVRIPSENGSDIHGGTANVEKLGIKRFVGQSSQPGKESRSVAFGCPEG